MATEQIVLKHADTGGVYVAASERAAAALALDPKWVRQENREAVSVQDLGQPEGATVPGPVADPPPPPPAPVVDPPAAPVNPRASR